MTATENLDPAAADAGSIEPLSGRFDALEGWRGIACLMVLTYHCGLKLERPPFAWYGSSGVQMFFVLSGYLLFRPYAAAMATGRATPSVKNFYLRRLIRIWPPYAVSLAVSLGIQMLNHARTPSPWNIVARLLLIFNYDPRINFYGVNVVYWSLAIEVQFYLLLPVISIVPLKLLGRSTAVWGCVAVTAIIGVLARAAELHWLGDFYKAVGNVDGVRFRSVFAYFDLFAGGMFVAALTVNVTGRFFHACRRPIAQLLLLITGLALSIAANDWNATAAHGGWQGRGSNAFLIGFSPTLTAGISLLLLAVVLHPRRGASTLRSRWLVFVGTISYSIYLYHVLLLPYLFRMDLFASWSTIDMAAGYTAVAIGPALALGAIMYWAIERPSLRLVARVRSRNRLVTAAACSPAGGASAAIELLGP